MKIHLPDSQLSVSHSVSSEFTAHKPQVFSRQGLYFQDSTGSSLQTKPVRYCGFFLSQHLKSQLGQQLTNGPFGQKSMQTYFTGKCGLNLTATASFFGGRRLPFPTQILVGFANQTSRLQSSSLNRETDCVNAAGLTTPDEVQDEHVENDADEVSKLW